MAKIGDLKTPIPSSIEYVYIVEPVDNVRKIKISDYIARRLNELQMYVLDTNDNYGDYYAYLEPVDENYEFKDEIVVKLSDIKKLFDI